MKKFISGVMMKSVLCVLALALVCTAALADFDLSRTGDISVRIHTAEDVNVEKARIVLYKVGDASVKDGNLVFALTDEFAASGVSLSDLGASGMAAALDGYLEANPGIAAYAEAVTDENGMAYFTGVECGLYMVVQDGFDSKRKVYFSEIESFMVQMPMTNEAGTDWDYSIEAQPKVNPLPTPKPTPKPTEAPGDETLPQTGMLKWPIPVLGVGGLLLFSLGWIMAFGKKRKHDA